MARLLKPNTIPSLLIAVGIIAVASIGGYFSAMNRAWYDALRKPSWQPPNWVFGPVWTIIFALTALSLILIWSARPHAGLTYAILAAAVVNGILNVGWSALFFGHRLIFPAIYDSALLCLSVIFIMILAWPISKTGSLLLIPYALWTAFATFLTYAIYRLNP